MTKPHPKFPELLKPRVTLEAAAGQKLLTSYTYGYASIAILVFEHGFVFLKAAADEDGCPQLQENGGIGEHHLHDLVSVGLLTQEAHAQHIVDSKMAALENAQESRRELYEKLKKEFEG
jgi:hypothetical protein